jgi:hypothetical protein
VTAAFRRTVLLRLTDAPYRCTLPMHLTDAPYRRPKQLQITLLTPKKSAMNLKRLTHIFLFYIATNLSKKRFSSSIFLLKIFQKMPVILRQFSILFLAATVLFSTIGANLYELCCDCEHLHEVSLFSQHHICKNNSENKNKNNSKNTATNKKSEELVKPLHACCVKKLLGQRWQQSFHKKSCCDFSAKYLALDAKYQPLKKEKNTCASKRIAPNKETKNIVMLAVFSEQLASLAQRLGSILHAGNHLLLANSYISDAFGRLMRIRLASFLC